eukprot:3253308-Rhodomonas_salina.1
MAVRTRSFLLPVPSMSLLTPPRSSPFLHTGRQGSVCTELRAEVAGQHIRYKKESEQRSDALVPLKTSLPPPSALLLSPLPPPPPQTLSLSLFAFRPLAPALSRI